MAVDPLASMRCWAVTVALGGREFEIPAMPAADWWPVLTDPSGAHLVDFLKSGPDDPLSAMLLDGTASIQDLEDVLIEAIGEVTGRSMHAALVLVAIANHRWDAIGGHLARSGFRWDIMPIGAALDAIYLVAMEGMDKDGQTKFLALLENESLSTPGKAKVPSERVVTEFETMAGPRPAPAPVPEKSIAALSGGARSRTRTRPRQRPRPGQSAGPS